MRGWRQGFELAPTANWDLATIRTFLYDPVNGNDANQGWSDSVGPYTPATQAKKTLAGIKSVLPVAFANRIFRLIMAAGTYTDGLDKLIGGITGYGATSLIRGTATNATAGTVAFSDDANDRIYQGWTTATGMNAPGYHPTGAPTTTVVQCLTLAGGAPGFGAEPALPLGARVRFSATTTTVALRNIARMVIAVSGTDTLTMDSALPAVPVAGDTFFIEMGGIALPAHTLSVAPTGVSAALQLCGMTSTGDVILDGGNFRLAGVKVNNLTCSNVSSINETTGYFEPVTGANVSIGGCMRAEGFARYQICGTATLAAHVHLGAGTFGPFTTTPLIGGSFIAAGSCSVSADPGQHLWSGSARIIAPGAGIAGMVVSGKLSISTGLDITGMGAKPCIRLQQGSWDFLNINAAVTGSTGNTDVGLDVSATKGAIISFLATPTFTGAGGDVRVASVGGTQVITWAQAMSGFVDSNGNTFINASLSPYRLVRSFSGVMITAGGGATTTYAADYSAGQTANQATAQQYPVSTRLITRLRLCAPSGTPADSGLTATLYKNGVATAMTCTIPASQAAGTKAVDNTHGILFGDADTFDVRINGASASNIPFTATLEGP